MKPPDVKVIVETPELDAFKNPQNVRPGCQHQLGCRCTLPFWLRASSPAELKREQARREARV